MVGLDGRNVFSANHVLSLFYGIKRRPSRCFGLVMIVWLSMWRTLYTVLTVSSYVCVLFLVDGDGERYVDELDPVSGMRRVGTTVFWEYSAPRFIPNTESSAAPQLKTLRGGDYPIQGTKTDRGLVSNGRTSSELTLPPPGRHRRR